MFSHFSQSHNTNTKNSNSLRFLFLNSKSRAMAGVNERVYTSCLPHEEDTGPVAPVCTYNYIGEVLHIYIEAAGATPVNTTVTITNVAPYELTVDAVVQCPNRGDRSYHALLLMPLHYYVTRNFGVIYA